MEIIGLSYFLNKDTPVYGGRKDVIEIKQVTSINNGDTANNLQISFPNHAGTHIDFPYHFSNDGKKCEDYDPSFWIFKRIGFIKCSVDKIEEAIVNLPGEIELLILKTGFGSKREFEEYWEQQPVIKAGFADLFRCRFSNLRAFGFDMISLTSKLDRAEGKEAHIQFLIENDILIIEDMKLDGLDECPDMVIVSPLLISGADGVPCNVVALFNAN
ncbi:MAG: cyclase family protein [Candidatus Pedobacter colombiensis]|uniref:Cyclase family protein n=1 Tax=Candidatus Pedobacter colombiensis TaxID=3121371 RepID=A0AAJ5W9C6_9SPHI|nr:cyclase family protein [Pedobacter sp.]WEK19663.1 MAG: cyclase family protein [Pedobacter sp.]